ncbi:MAG: PaaI family thioesterase [Thermacetogeniaceae bacterium]
MEEQIYDHCFVCGPRNATGLQLKIAYDNGEARAELLADARWEGYPGVVHGGVLCALLDDLVCHAAYSAIGQYAITATIEVRFRSPARVGSYLCCRARVDGAGPDRPSAQGRLVEAEGEIHDRDGRLIATAKSKLMIMSQDQLDGFIGT